MLKFAIFLLVFTISIRVTQADFLGCCEEAGLSEELRKKICVYPPVETNDISSNERGEMAKKVNEYTQCYTKGKDNTACCEENGVNGKYKICQVFCNGAPNHPTIVPSKDQAICGKVQMVISNCNSKSE